MYWNNKENANQWSLQIEPARRQLVKMTTRSGEKERRGYEFEGQSLGPPMDEVGGRKVGRGECGRPIAHRRHLGMYPTSGAGPANSFASAGNRVDRSPRQYHVENSENFLQIINICNVYHSNK